MKVLDDPKDWWDALAEPFPLADIEWRVMRAKPYEKVECTVYPYVTARGIHERLDEVVGPQNWVNTPQVVCEVRPGVLSIQVGISIRVNGEWLTKYNVSEATTVEPAKGAFSQAEKRAAEEWGIGRYLYLLGEGRVETTRKDPMSSDWRYARVKDGSSSKEYWWKIPELPTWALPRVAGDERVTQKQLNDLKRAWAQKFAPGETDPAVLATRFAGTVFSKFNKVPADNKSGWTQAMIEEMHQHIRNATFGDGPSADVPFEGVTQGSGLE